MTVTSRIMRWLPEPTSGDSEAIRRPPDELDLAELVRLSRFDWDAGNLRRLASAAGYWRNRPDGQDLLRSARLQGVRVVLISNATAKHLVEPLIGSGIRHGLLIEVMVVEYGDPQAAVERETAAIAAFQPDIVVAALDTHGFALSESLGDAAGAAETVEREISRLAILRQQLSRTIGVPVILHTIAANSEASRLHVDASIEGSYRRLVAFLNVRIGELARESGDLVLDIASLAENVGLRSWFSARYWAMAKYPFAPDMVPLYTDQLAKLIALRFGKSKRVLVLDLDNTLWGGIVGDDGKESLVLGPGSPAGEAHAALQQMAKTLRRRGIVLCVSSKNEESVALDAFRTHPEMVLTEEDIAVFQINWQDKAANLSTLAKKLDLGLDSFVFVDDNPAERARVRFALTDVAVPELPRDVTEWLPVLQAANYFETTGFTREDRERSDYYRANIKRAAQLEKLGGYGDYLESLAMEMELKPFDVVGRKRIAQLIAKSNQFNLTTRRYSESEVAALEADPTVSTFQARLKDVFGDNGMISVIIARHASAALEIDTWLMSCRVLGRSIPEALLNRLVEEALRLGKPSIRGSYVPSAKNMMVADHYKNLGFDLVATESNGVTWWELPVRSHQPKPSPIKISEERTLAAPQRENVDG